MERFLYLSEEWECILGTPGPESSRVQWARTKAAEQQPDIQRKSVHPGPRCATLCSSSGFRHHLALTWFGFQVLAFGSVSVSMTTQSCLSHACYLAATSGFTHGTPPYSFNLSWSLRPSFSLSHATPGFQLRSTRLCFHPTHAHIQMPASGSRYRQTIPSQPIPTWVCWTHSLREMMEIQQVPRGSRRRESTAIKSMGFEFRREFKLRLSDSKQAT